MYIDASLQASINAHTNHSILYYYTILYTYLIILRIHPQVIHPCSSRSTLYRGQGFEGVALEEGVSEV